jgi:hypothetical protein
MTQQKKGVKYVLWGTGILAIAGLSYWFFGSNTATAQVQPDFEPEEPSKSNKPTPQTTSNTQRPRITGGSSGFPLRKGSKGNNVKLLQQALMRKYGSTILPDWGADGDWGTETQNALISKGIPTVISESDFNKIVQGSAPKTGNTNSSKGKKFDPLRMSNSLHSAIGKHDFTKTLRLLSYIHTVNGYKSVNEYFKSKRPSFGSGVRMTLVSALLYKYKSSWGKKKLNNHFHRIGLQFNGSKWSLDGVTLVNQIKTIRSTRVWNQVGDAMIVPVHTVLGRFEAAKNGITRFITLDGKTLYVNTPMVSYV